MDPFGVEEVVLKRDKKRAEHYGRMSGAMGTIGVTAGSVGAGSHIVGRMERKGKDPMGFTARDSHLKKPLRGAVKMRILKPMAEAHAYQAKAMGGIGAAGLALSAAYHHKKKKELAKRDRKKRSASDAALAAGSAATGVAALKTGGRFAHHLNQQAKIGETEARTSHHLIVGQRLGGIDMDAAETKFHHAQRKTGLRVSAVKRPAALAATTAAAAGGAGLYELGRYGSKKLKRKRP